VGYAAEKISREMVEDEEEELAKKKAEGTEAKEVKVTNETVVKAFTSIASEIINKEMVDEAKTLKKETKEEPKLESKTEPEE
jgi:hypothetical protein